MSSPLPRHSTCPTCGGPSETVVTSADAIIYKFISSYDERFTFEKELIERRIAGAERRINELRRELENQREPRGGTV